MYTFRTDILKKCFLSSDSILCVASKSYLYIFGRGAWNSGGGPQERHQETPTGMARPLGGPAKKKKHGTSMENDG